MNTIDSTSNTVLEQDRGDADTGTGLKISGCVYTAGIDRLSSPSYVIIRHS